MMEEAEEFSVVCLAPRAGFLPPLPSLYAYQNFIRIFYHFLRQRPQGDVWDVALGCPECSLFYCELMRGELAAFCKTRPLLSSSVKSAEFQDLPSSLVF